MNTTFEATNSKSRVLIVDDNSRFARGAQLFLEHTGNYFACAVNDPRRALETARSCEASDGIGNSGPVSY
jgi:CheY-like chemotaxis protein